MIEMFKVKMGIAPKTINEIFELVKLPYNLRNNFRLKSDNINTTFYGTETLSFLGPRLWKILPNKFKNSNTLDQFKTKIKDWRCEDCPCRLCKKYIPELGFL